MIETVDKDGNKFDAETNRLVTVRVLCPRSQRDK